jgi:perosamine synthetase
MAQIGEKKMILVNEPLLTGNEKTYLQECIDTGWISSEGPFVKKFEDQFASYIGVGHGVAVCNGSAAIEAALYGLGLVSGDEVIIPSFTIISCATACLRLGIKPVLVDCDPEILTLDVEAVAAKITPRTKAIMAVHIYGHSADMDPLLALAEKHDLKIIEDAAEAHGAQYLSKRAGEKWLKCGAIGHVSTFSFYANKIITTGEGGMVLTQDDAIAERVRSYRNLCFRSEERFYHTDLGFNFRMTNLQAAVGVAQMERIDTFLKIKDHCASVYFDGIKTIPNINMLPVKPWCKSVYWMYGVMLNPEIGINAKDVMARLRQLGIGSRPFFRGLHTQPAFHDRSLFKDDHCPVTDHAYKYGFYIPSGLALTDEQMASVLEALGPAVNG